MQSGPSFGHELASCAKHIPADGPVLSSDVPDELGHVIKSVALLMCCHAVGNCLVSGGQAR